MADSVFPGELVFADVRDRFASEFPNVNVVFGWREPPKNINQGVGSANRIAFVPGVAGALGDYVGARQTGRIGQDRVFRTLVESFQVYCWAFDGTSEQNAHSDLAQWRAARSLHDAAVRAIELAMRRHGLGDLPSNKGKSPFSKAEWLLPDAQIRLGAEIRFVLTLESVITNTLPNLQGVGGTPPNTDTTSLETDRASTVTFDAEIADTTDSTTPEADPPPDVFDSE